MDSIRKHFSLKQLILILLHFREILRSSIPATLHHKRVTTLQILVEAKRYCQRLADKVSIKLRSSFLSVSL